MDMHRVSSRRIGDPLGEDPNSSVLLALKLLLSRLLLKPTAPDQAIETSFLPLSW